MMKLNLRFCFFVFVVCQGLLLSPCLGQTDEEKAELTSRVCAKWIHPGGNNVCEECAADYYIMMDSCYECPDGKSSEQGAFLHNCYACTDANCKHCGSTSVGTCQTCRVGYYLDNGSCVVCPSGTTASAGGNCAFCAEECSSCLNPNKNSCTNCKENYYIPSAPSGECVHCPEGTYSLKDAVGIDQCIACSDGCKSCSGPGSGKCSTCKADFYLVNNDCTACPSGQVAPEGSTSSAACVTCVGNGCIGCDANYKCNNCDYGLYLKKNQCVSCGPSMTSQQGTNTDWDCFGCEDESCLSCTSPGKGVCTSCADGWYLTGDNTCGDCGGSDGKCTKCTADNKCKTCEFPYFVTENGQCEACPSGYYPDSKTTKVSECKKCEDSNCNACNGAGTEQCTECDGELVPQLGQCRTCGSGKYLDGLGGPYYWGDCKDCPEGCDLCAPNKSNTKLSCSTCTPGYAFDKVNSCLQCGDRNCLSCTETGTGQCTKCKEGYFVTAGNTCKACGDENCATCSSNGKCSKCKDRWYLTSDKSCKLCKAEFCDVCASNGKCATCVSNWYLADDQTCEYCGVENCKTCGSGGKCSTCKSGFYLAKDKTCKTCMADNCNVCSSTGGCATCKTGYYVAEDETCKVCQADNCNVCSSTGGCATCRTGFFAAVDETCKTCEDENCKACDGANIGSCTSCDKGFKLVSGTCKASGEEAPKTNNMVSATIRYDLTMTQFNEEGGKNYFIAKTSRVLGVDIEQVTVSDVRKGSVIVDYEVALSGDDTAAKNMKKAMDAAVPGGHMDFYTGGKVLNYDSQVGSRDSGDGGSSSKIGIIIGIVAGVVCVIIAFVIWKKISIMKAKKMGSMNVKNKNKVIAIDDSAEKGFKVEQVSA